MSEYLKPLHGNAIPRRIWYAVPESHRVMNHNLEITPYQTGSAVWATHRHYSTYRYIGEDKPVRYTLIDFWKKLSQSLVKGTKTYLVAPIASDLMTLARFWDLVAAGKFKISNGIVKESKRYQHKSLRKHQRGDRLVMNGTPDIITFTRKGMICKALSFSNYIQTDWKSVFESTGWQTSKVYSDNKEIAWMDYDPSDICVAMRIWLERCMIDWKYRNIGPWQDTIGELSLSMYRAGFMTTKVLRHDDEAGLAIEESGLYGGRATAFYLGDIGNRSLIKDLGQPLPVASSWQMPDTKIHKLDVVSMYPSIFRDKKFPVRLRSVLYDVDPKDVLDISYYYGVIASCVMKPKVPEYPHRMKDRIVYPYGKFLSTLAGPELTTACGAGEVESIVALCKYEMSPAFQEWGEYVISARQDSRSENDKASELFWKCIANSFGGKFAQRKRKWVYQPDSIPPFQWGEYLILINDTGEVKQMKAIANCAYCLVEGGIGYRLPAAVYVYLCAYGRYLMRGIRNEIGHANVLSQDTDGLFVTDTGLDNAFKAGATKERIPGRIRYVSTHSYARFFDARHYCIDGEWTLAGIRDGFEVLGGNVLKERVIANPARSGVKSIPRTMYDGRREVRMDRIANCQITDELGWMVSPIVHDIPSPPD